MKQFLIFIACLGVLACGDKPQTLMERCVQLQKQSEADVACVHQSSCAFTADDRARHDSGFIEYKAKCVGPDGKGIAPSAPVAPEPEAPLPGANKDLMYSV